MLDWKDFFFDLDEEPKTLVDILRWRGTHQADKRAYTYLEDGDKKEVHITYGELDQKARAIAATLQKQNMQGERVLLLYPPCGTCVSARPLPLKPNPATPGSHCPGCTGKNGVDHQPDYELYEVN